MKSLYILILIVDLDSHRSKTILIFLYTCTALSRCINVVAGTYIRHIMTTGNSSSGDPIHFSCLFWHSCEPITSSAHIYTGLKINLF